MACVVLVYNKWEQLRKCLSALRASTYENLRVIVVDNCSSAPPPGDLLPLLERYQYIRNERNLGYAGGNNVGIRWALRIGAEYVLILNDDAYVDEDCIDSLVTVLETNPNAGAVGPTVLRASEPDTIQSAGGMWSETRLRSYQRDEGKRTHRLHRTTPSAFYIDGCCLMLRLSALEEVGLFYEGFFIYYEDIELCVRLLGAGYLSLVVPWTRVKHEVGGTFLRSSPFNTYFSHRNRFLFVLKTSTGLRGVLRFFRLLLLEIQAVRKYLQMNGEPEQVIPSLKRREVRAWIMAFLHGLLGIEGPGPPWVYK